MRRSSSKSIGLSLMFN